jgi:hypothetical protein
MSKHVDLGRYGGVECSESKPTENDMRWTGIVVLAAVALAIPVMAFAQAAPMGAWCASSYGAEGTNFAPCVPAQSGTQVAGQASGIQPQMAGTEPQYPAGMVTFENGQAVFNKQVLNLNFGPSRDRSAEPQSE